ncbi:MAG: TetR family transcriptional regulator [Planctomycetaceae bacterium]|nr:TetR family transcriptional regulator [Planctomycetaceae bacterium]
MTTRDDILAAAVEIFAEKGFDGASVREICQAAGTNSAAINYHFESKAALYRSVVELAYRSATIHPMPTLHDHEGDPDRALTEWISWYLHRILEPGGDAANRLLLRESASPSGALDGFVASVIYPVYRGLESIVDAICPAELDARTRQLHCVSILGQCLVHRVCRPMLEQLPVEPPIHEADLAEIAAVVTANALAAIRADHAARSRNR